MSLRFGHAKPQEGGDTQAQQATRFGGVLGLVPTTNGVHATRGQAAEKMPPRFDRIEAVLAEGEGPGARGCPGVDQTHLNDVERLVGAGKPAAALIDDQLDPVEAIKPGEVCEARFRGQELDEDRVDLDAGDVPIAYDG